MDLSLHLLVCCVCLCVRVYTCVYVCQHLYTTVYVRRSEGSGFRTELKGSVLAFHHVGPGD